MYKEQAGYVPFESNIVGGLSIKRNYNENTNNNKERAFVQHRILSYQRLYWNIDLVLEQYFSSSILKQLFIARSANFSTLLGIKVNTDLKW